MRPAFVFAYLSFFTTLAVPIVTLIKRGIWRKEFYFFLLYIFLSALVDSILFFESHRDKNNMIIVNAFVFVQTLLLTILLYKWMNSKATKVLTMVGFIGISALVAYRFSLQQKVVVFDEISNSIEGIFLMLLTGYVLVQLAANVDIPLFKNPKFWITAGTFLYFTVTNVIFCTVNFGLSKSENLMRSMWIFNLIVSILTNVTYIIGILWIQKRTT